jgi:hypothetical protein
MGMLRFRKRNKRVRVWTISFPHRVVGIALQVHRTGFPIATTLAASTAAEAARHLFMTRQRMHTMVKDGIIPRSPDGCYDLDDTRRRYIESLRRSALAYGRSCGIAALRREREGFFK